MKRKEMARRIAELEAEVSALRARLAVLETDRFVPYPSQGPLTIPVYPTRYVPWTDKEWPGMPPYQITCTELQGCSAKSGTWMMRN